MDPAPSSKPKKVVLASIAQSLFINPSESPKLTPAQESSHAVATELVDWAEQQKVINLEQRRARGSPGMRSFCGFGVWVLAASVPDRHGGVGFLIGVSVNRSLKCQSCLKVSKCVYNLYYPETWKHHRSDKYVNEVYTSYIVLGKKRSSQST